MKKSSTKLLAKQIKQYIRRITHHDQVGLIPECKEWFSIHKSVNVMHNINKMKDKHHMIISVDAERYLTRFNIHL